MNALDTGPFNRWKVLNHRLHLDGIVKGEFLPPYWVAVDPSNECPHKCYYCNARKYRYKTKYAKMPRRHLLRICDMICDWGVEAVILEGGGEPLANNETADFIHNCHMYGIEIGLVTNGVHMGEEYADILPHCARWVGISFDSPTAKIYRKIRGIDTFDVVCENVARLNAKRKEIASDIDVTLKMLFGRWNVRQIYEFVKLAKELGCTRAHVKPVSLDRVVGAGKMKLERYADSIADQCSQAKELEDDSFKVDIVTHKLDERFRQIIRFSRCESTPLGGVFGADGWFHLCYNMRGFDGFRLVEHYPDPWTVKRVWGTEYHKSLIARINPHDCMRCGQTDVNQIIEDCVRQDKMYRRFP